MVLNHLKSKQISELFEFDQLSNARKLDAAFSGFDEETPTFFPTFKLVKAHHQESDSDVKSEEFAIATVSVNDSLSLNYYLQRIPAYCDRILVKSAKVAKKKNDFPPLFVCLFVCFFF